MPGPALACPLPARRRQARQRQARDIRDVRNIGGSSYNKGLLDVLDYYRKNHPDIARTILNS
jgi:hypothetical protein